MKRVTLVLAAHSLSRIRVMVFALGLLLAAFQFLLTQVAQFLLRRSAFGQLSAMMPDFVRSAAGPSALAFMSFGGIVGFGYFHPIVLAALVSLGIAIATEPSAEVEGRFVDLTLARPLTRSNLMTRTVIVFVVSSTFVLGAMLAGTWIGLTCCTPADAPRPSARLILSLAANLAALMVCWSGVALALAASARRRAVAGSVAGTAALAAYLVDYLGRAWEPARGVSVVSPFHYFEPAALVGGQPLGAWNMIVLVGTGVLATVIAYVVFSQRDI